VETMNWDVNGRGWLAGGYFEHVLDGTIQRAKSKERGRRSVREDTGGRAVCGYFFACHPRTRKSYSVF